MSATILDAAVFEGAEMMAGGRAKEILCVVDSCTYFQLVPGIQTTPS